MSEADRILEDIGRSAKGFARSTLGQGLGMGWGDEAEAWLKSKIGQGSYEDNLNRIRQEYGEYSEDNPTISGLGEFGGAVAPGIVTGALSATPAAPVAAPAAAATGTRMLGALGRIAAKPAVKAAAVGTGTGALSAAGAAPEGERTSAAIGGGGLGLLLGTALPPLAAGAGAAARWARERFANTPGYVSGIAARKINTALGESGQGPQDLMAMMQQYRDMDVPGVVANATPALTDLGEAVAQRTGPGTRKIEQAVGSQKSGSRERVNQQVRKGLNPGDYYADEERLIDELRDKAGTMYDNAYSFGPVDDPTINYVLSNPVFAAAYQRGQAIARTKAMSAKLKGEDPSKYLLPDLYVPSGSVDPITNAPIMQLAKDARPTVMSLDYVKRGLDDMLDRTFSGSSSAGKGEASALKDLRNQFVAAIDRNVPAYRDARKMYAGDMEVRDALRSGYEEFGNLDHEQVVKMLGSMSQGEKDAFRTGAARHFYGLVNNPSNNTNSAKKIINSPETRKKLEPLFDSPSHYRLFEAAMEREMQLFDQANKMLAGSQTAKRTAMRGSMDASTETGAVLADAVTGGWMNSMANLGMRMARKSSMSEQMADKLADMLVSKDPHEVAAVIQLLEEQAKKDAVTPARIGSAAHGAITGASSFWPPSMPEQPQE